MALIGKIRKNSWILIVMIGLGLGGFIIMDMTSGQQSVFGSGQFTMGEVDGEKLDWNDFYRTEQVLYQNSAGDIYARRDFLWNYYVEEALVKKEAEELGLGVSKTELLDLQFGANPSSVIVQRFQNPQAPGQVDRQQLNFVKQLIDENRIAEAVQNGQINANFISFWAHQEQEIIKDRLQNKMNNLVAKGMYTPTWMAEMGHSEQNQRIDFAYVQVPFDEIDNTEITISDSDYSAFLQKNAAKYTQDEETRKVDYVAFDVFPTAQDSANLRKKIADLIPEFESSDDDSSYVQRHNGRIDGTYYKKASLSPAIKDTVFSLPVGTVYGPYQDGTNYMAVKIIDRKVIPDSVRSRHILRPATNALQLAQAQKTIDSLKTLIEDGTHIFDSLAVAFGTDATASKGGDLGYTFSGGMVKPFNDLIFFEAEEGKLYTVITQFGVHLVEVTGKKFINNEEGVKLAYLLEAIEPSKETQDAAYEKASEFIVKNRTLDEFVKAASEDPSISVQTSAGLKQNDFSLGTLGAGQSSRDIARWAFGADVGEVSPEVTAFQSTTGIYDAKYVVVALKSIQKAGLPSVANIKDEIEQLVINEKKGELLKEKIQGKSLSELASTYSTQVDTARNVSFSQAFVPNLGNEPSVIATAFNTEEGGASAPIVGNSGVYLINVTKKPTLGPATNIPQLRNTMNVSARAQVASRLMQALKKEADIEDNRSRFY